MIRTVRDLLVAGVATVTLVACGAEAPPPPPTLDPAAEILSDAAAAKRGRLAIEHVEQQVAQHLAQLKAAIARLEAADD